MNSALPRMVQPVNSEALRSLMSGVLPMAVASGSDAGIVRDSLKAIGILDWFETVITPVDVARGKPAPDMFLLAAERMVETTRLLAFQEGNLVLVEIDSLNQITSVQDATAWVLGLVEHYLAYGVTPEALEQEIERAERWRQSLTLKSQEVDRRALETAARRDEIQELERSLKQEREELETRWEALQQIQADAPPPAEG